MPNLLRQTVFLTLSIILRWPLFALIGLIGRTGIFKTVFLVYATDEIEALGICPNISFIRRYLSGKPTPSGLIMNGWLPMGIYLVIPDLTKDLALKKNRHIAEEIVRRMHWFRRLAGARTIGLAGQLGPIFSRRHNIPMEPPIFASTFGNVFSINESINWIARQKSSFLHRQKIAVIGRGELGNSLQEHLKSQGYCCDLIDVRYTIKGKVVLTHNDKNREQLKGVDFVINLMPKGEEFMASNVGNIIPPNASIIDFSRPPIPVDQVVQKVYMGNRIRRPNLRFIFSLPGGWTQKQLPACSLPSILAAMTGQISNNLDSFCLLARQQSFSTALVDTPITTQTEKQSFWNKLEDSFEFETDEELTAEGVELLSQK